MDERIKLDHNFKNSFVGEIIKVCNTSLLSLAKPLNL